MGDATPALTGADLAAWRARHGLTQQAAADRLGVRQGTVSKAESRGSGALGPPLREALAGVLAEELHSTT
ncbi:MAG: helix-turn-helix transcriptional regulator [Alphaproteobacteria bacterium]|nr:helix-turn-helix transcriptional regulator [Alphaproteobacteria bacterium]